MDSNDNEFKEEYMNPELNPNQNTDKAPASSPVTAYPAAPDSSAAILTKKAPRKLFILIAVGVIALALIGYGVYVAAQAVTKKNDHVVTDNTTKNDSQNNARSNDPSTITTTLPNGKIATYPDNKGNREIGFVPSKMGDDYVGLTHAGVADFIATVDPATVARLCGENGELAQKDGVIVGTISTSVRMIQYPSKRNCVDELATLRNKDADVRAVAAQVAKQINIDIEQFYQNVVIK